MASSGSPRAALWGCSVSQGVVPDVPTLEDPRDHGRLCNYKRFQKVVGGGAIFQPQDWKQRVGWLSLWACDFYLIFFTLASKGSCKTTRQGRMVQTQGSLGPQEALLL